MELPQELKDAAKKLYEERYKDEPIQQAIQVYELRQQGWTFQKIADELGWNHRDKARSRFQRYKDRIEAARNAK